MWFWYCFCNSDAVCSSASHYKIYPLKNLSFKKFVSSSREKKWVLGSPGGLVVKSEISLPIGSATSLDNESQSIKRYHLFFKFQTDSLNTGRVGNTLYLPLLANEWSNKSPSPFFAHWLLEYVTTIAADVADRISVIILPTKIITSIYGAVQWKFVDAGNALQSAFWPLYIFYSPSVFFHTKYLQLQLNVTDIFIKWMQTYIFFPCNIS